MNADKEWAHRHLVNAMNAKMREIPDIPENKYLKILHAQYFGKKKKKKKKHKHIEEPKPKKRFELNGHINDTFDEDMKKIDDLLNQLPGLPKPRRRVVRRRRRV